MTPARLRRQISKVYLGEEEEGRTELCAFASSMRADKPKVKTAVKLHHRNPKCRPNPQPSLRSTRRCSTSAFSYPSSSLPRTELTPGTSIKSRSTVHIVEKA
ncbi:hypothetical protein DY000_02033653 [Brassica cretica]|uniref:Uncharacterized protein n=1 Tax=Brassica cretica TaxID=69181 RepID=A0ABQ7E009_BRACR|nr:hypothetical protein DY000_02033653 [Brassica cretica]